MAVNKARAKIENVPAHELERFKKAQEKRARKLKRKKEANDVGTTN